MRTPKTTLQKRDLIREKALSEARTCCHHKKDRHSRDHIVTAAEHLAEQLSFGNLNPARCFRAVSLRLTMGSCLWPASIQDLQKQMPQKACVAAGVCPSGFLPQCLKAASSRIGCLAPGVPMCYPDVAESWCVCQTHRQQVSTARRGWTSVSSCRRTGMPRRQQDGQQPLLDTQPPVLLTSVSSCCFSGVAACDR